MQAITAAQLVALILQYGIPAAIKLVDAIFSKTDADGNIDWPKLKTSLQVTATDLAIADMKSKGIDPNSPESQATLALLK